MAATRGTRRVGAFVGITLACALGLAGCATGGRQADGRTQVVASTDVWGSIAASIAGADATVTSIARGASDPHSFEPTPAAAAAIADADLVVYNGGGYDAWVTKVLDNVREARPGVSAVDAYALLDAAAIGERRPADEHVFYELGTAIAVADQIAARLAEADPANTGQYRSRAKEFIAGARKVLDDERALRQRFADTAVVATEPVAHYLLLAAGLTDKTPRGFTEAIAQDSDAAPADIAAMLDLIDSGQVAALIFNDQTVTGATRRIRDAAQAAGVPVVSVTETLPAGMDYLDWQADTARRLAAALQRDRP